jgi:hypothetical protein
VPVTSMYGLERLCYNYLWLDWVIHFAAYV